MVTFDFVIGPLPGFSKQIINLPCPLQAVLRFIDTKTIPDIYYYPVTTLPVEDLGAFARALTRRLAIVIPFVQVRME